YTKQTGRFVLLDTLPILLKSKRRAMAKAGKKRIIDTAFQLFLKQGYKGVSLNDIIANSGLSKGAIYHHFKSKYDIYLAAIDYYYFQLLATSFPEDGHLSFKARLRFRFEAFASVLEAIEHLSPEGTPFPIRTYFIFQLESEQDQEIRERVVTTMQAYRVEITQLVQEAIDKQEIQIGLPASTIAQQLMAMMEGLAIHNSTIETDCKAFLLDQFDQVIATYIDLLISQPAKTPAS
ncbi:MAG: TetR/AcrR family transcriptional regulator, partial [Bacteroidota bacterium]